MTKDQEIFLETLTLEDGMHLLCQYVAKYQYTRCNIIEKTGSD